MSVTYVRRVIEEMAEGLIRTTPYPRLLQFLTPTWGTIFKPFLGAVVVDVNGLPIDKLRTLVRDLDLHGWFPSLIGDDEESEPYTAERLATWAALATYMKFEAKFDPIITDPAPVYWHAAPLTRAAKIETLGLGPRAGSKLGAHPDRVYLASTEFNAMHMARQLANITRVPDYVIFKVDPAVRNHGHPIILYSDPNWIHGAYTYDVIPPAALTRYITFNASAS